MRKFAAAIALILFVLAVFFGIFTAFAHAATTSKRGNALGVVVSDVDPNMTIVATLIAGEPHYDRDGRVGVNLRLHPKYTYGLFDTSIMFCGDIVGMFDNRQTQYQALTYRREASRLIDGIPCHELKGVDDVANSPRP